MSIIISIGSSGRARVEVGGGCGYGGEDGLAGRR